LDVDIEKAIENSNIIGKGRFGRVYEFKSQAWKK